jgi:hypothetical protein
MHKHLQEGQTLYVAGGFDEPIKNTCWSVQYSKLCCDPVVWANAVVTTSYIPILNRQ